MIVVAIIAVVSIIIDQISKFAIADYYMNVSKEPIVIINNVLDFTYAENTGAAFSLLEGAQWFFIPLTIIACLVLVYVLIRIGKIKKNHWLMIISSGLIIGGAIGNLIDRIMFGYVRDFIHVNIRFAIFNFADCCVVVGGIALAIYLLFVHDKYIPSNTKNQASAKTLLNENIEEVDDRDI